MLILTLTLTYLMAIIFGAALHALLMRPRGAHAVPGGPLPEPVHPRFGPLLDTPPDGITTVRPDGEITVGGTGGFAPLCQTPDSPPWEIETGSFSRIEEEDEEEDEEEAPPPTSADQDAEQERASYVREHLPECTATPEVLERVHAGLRGEHPYMHANGWL